VLGGLLARAAITEGVGKMSFDGMSLFAIVVVLILGYVVGRMWATPAQLVGLP
jgi:uncharacterized membrane protein YcaP (DUF421 family)